MDIPEDQKERERWVLDLLIENYGVRGKVIDKYVQPNAKGLPLPEQPPEKTKKRSAKAVKGNDRLYDIIDFFRREHGLFTNGTFYTDCPIHSWFGDLENDTNAYQDVFKIIPRTNGYLAFTCKKDCVCQHHQCPIHPSMPFKDQRFDPIDLLEILDLIKHGRSHAASLGTKDHYAKKLASALGIETKQLRAKKGESPEGLGRHHGKRYPCDKRQLLIEIMTCVPSDDREVDKFLDRIDNLVFQGKEPEDYYDRSPVTETVWLPIGLTPMLRSLKAASRLWLYIWILQQGQRNKVVPDAKKFGEALKVDRKTIYRYRDILLKAERLRIEKKENEYSKQEWWSVTL